MKNYYQRCGASLMGTEAQKIQSLKEMEKSGDYIAQSKCDGMWAVISNMGDGNKIYSRNQKERAYPLPELSVGTMLVGELGTSSEEATKRQQELGHNYMDVFDILIYKSEWVGFKSDVERLEILDKFLKESNDETKKCYLKVKVYTKDFVKNYKEENEGLVLKKVRGIDSSYLPGSTNTNWIKCKHEYDFDMVIMDYELSVAETKKSQPMVKSVIVGQYIDGTLTKLTKVGNMPLDMCKDIAQNFKNYKNKVVTIHGYKQFKSGAIRHASYKCMRDDKDAKDCTFRPEEC